MDADQLKESDFCTCSHLKAEQLYDKYNEKRKLSNQKPYDELEMNEKAVWLSVAGKRPIKAKTVKSEFK